MGLTRLFMGEIFFDFSRFSIDLQSGSDIITCDTIDLVVYKGFGQDEDIDASAVWFTVDD
jgi:hypothetical protein